MPPVTITINSPPGPAPFVRACREPSGSSAGGVYAPMLSRSNTCVMCSSLRSKALIRMISGEIPFSRETTDSIWRSVTSDVLTAVGAYGFRLDPELFGQQYLHKV